MPMADSKNQPSTETDPRRRLAQKYLQAANEELDAKEAEKPRAQRKRPTNSDGQPTLANLTPSVAGSTFVHAILLSILLTLAALAAIWLTCPLHPSPQSE